MKNNTYTYKSQKIGYRSECTRVPVPTRAVGIEGRGQFPKEDNFLGGGVGNCLPVNEKKLCHFVNFVQFTESFCGLHKLQSTTR